MLTGFFYEITKPRHSKLQRGLSDLINLITIFRKNINY
ncbi:hypothetical protein MMC2321_04644 [Chitinophaga sp. MM2321]